MKSTILLGAIALLFTSQLVSLPSFGSMNIAAVQSAINNNQAGWIAKKTWLNDLSPEELKRMMGVKSRPAGTLDFSGTEAKGAIDWRSKDGINWIGPVMNQGNCGSCVAFATVATLQSQIGISTGLPWLNPALSPQALFACGGGGCESGWMPASAARFLKSTGVPDSACLPYTSGSTGNDVSCSNKCADAKARSFKTSGSTTPSGGMSGSSADAVKAALAKGPLVTTLDVYSDFITYGGGVYKHVTGDNVGGHAVSLIGYDDTKKAWLIRNSWGPEWGENGFAWMSYDDVSGIAVETWALGVTPTASYVSVVSPAERAIASGNALLTSEVGGKTSIDASSTFNIASDDGKITSVPCVASARATSCGVNFDSTRLQDGHYQIYAQSKSGVKSQIREFFVLNHEPSLSMSFTPIDGVDLSKPLNGRPEFNIVADSGAVPMSFVEFRVMDASGKIVSRKSNPYVLSNMKMGWRTITVKDGQYKIFFHGEMTYLGKVYSVDSAKVAITVANKAARLAKQ